jgi:hypothetical protein
MSFCERCGNWHDDRKTRPCSCKKYQVSVKEWDKAYRWKPAENGVGYERDESSAYYEWHDVWDKAPQYAASSHIQQREQEQAEYLVIKGDSVTVYVRGENGIAKQFTVHGQMVPEYWSERAGGDEIPRIPEDEG